MTTYIDFDNNDQQTDKCAGDVYKAFIDYAFSQSNYFMLVYVNYYGNGFTMQMKQFHDALKPYKLKRRSDPSWPGVPWTYCRDTTYKIVYYRNDDTAKEILKQVDKMSDWSRPSYPQDLAFFKGNNCWFYSVGHEKMATIINPTKSDLNFVQSFGLANKKIFM